jgi:MYXO-CTERM domain-containing protein
MAVDGFGDLGSLRYASDNPIGTDQTAFNFVDSSGDGISVENLADDSWSELGYLILEADIACASSTDTCAADGLGGTYFGGVVGTVSTVPEPPPWVKLVVPMTLLVLVALRQARRRREVV